MKNAGRNIQDIFRLTLLILFLCFPCFRADACFHKRFDVAAYGKDENAIAKLVAEVNLNKGGRIIFPENEKYVLTITDDPNGGHRLLPQDSAIPFCFKNCSYLEIDLNGSSIILEKNHSSKYAVFLFNNCQSFVLKNGFIIGDAKDHDYSPVVFMKKTEKSSHEWGHGIMVIGSKGEISGVSVSYMPGDGIYVASTKDSGKVVGSKIDITGCDISFCRRNGISCASNIGFNLMDSTIHEIGSYGGLDGTNPMAGIDFEFEDGVGSLGRVIISGCTIKDCEKKTVTTSNTFVPKVLSFEVSHSSFYGSSFQIANLLSNKGKFVKNCQFVEAPINCGKTTVENCVFTMGTKLHYVHGTCFKHCSFEGKTDGLKEPYGCALVGNSLDTAVFEDCEFKDIRGMNNTSPAYQGISGYNFPLTAHFSRCIFKNTSFVKGNPKNESSFTFEDCVLTNRCMIYNEGGEPIRFKNSVVDNVSSYSTQRGEFFFDNCEIIQNDETVSNPLLYFGTHSVKNSKVTNTLTITPQMRAKGIRSIKVIEK